MKKVSELEGPELDYWVARAEGLKKGQSNWVAYSSKWSVGGPIIDKEEIELVHRNGMDGRTLWAVKDNVIMRGDTKLIAAMRCYVASKFGEEVDDRQAHHI